MINKLLITCLQRNKRLVIPTLGAFIRKNIEGVGVILVFVPFLNKDDGVLCSAIKSWAGVEDEEAAQILEEYIAAVKNSLDERGQYIIESVGVLKYDTNKIIYLAKESEAVKEEVAKPEVEQKSEEQEPIVDQPKVATIPKSVPVVPPTPTPVISESHDDDKEPVKEPQIPQYNRPIYDRSTQTDMGTRYFSPVRKTDEELPSSEMQSGTDIQQPRQNPASMYNQIQKKDNSTQVQQNNTNTNGYGRYRDPQQRISNIYGSGSITPPPTPSPQINQQPSDRSTLSSPMGANKRPQMQQRQGAPRPPQKKKKGNDFVLWVAIIAVILTIMVLIYGYIYGGEQTIDAGALIEQVQNEASAGGQEQELAPTTDMK